MHEYGIWSILPPVIAIFLAIITRQVYVSLIFGLYLGWVILDDGNIFLAFLDTLEALVKVFMDPGNTRTIIFSALIGAVILYIQRSGGVEGFIRWINQRLEKVDGNSRLSQRIWVQFMAWICGMIIFVESSISVLTVGSLFRPLFDKLKISREKLAYIADSTSAPTCVLIPFNGWGALIMGLLFAQGFDNPFQVMMQTMVFNFYAWITILSVFLVIFFGWDLRLMKKAEARTATGMLLWPNAQPLVSEDVSEVPPKAGVPPRAYNMLIPLLVMVLMMPFMLMYTGWDAALEGNPDADWIQTAFVALGKGSGSTSVLVGVTVAILASMALYAMQGFFTLKENIDIIFKGISGLMPIALLLLFAFAIGAVCRELQTGEYLASVAKAWLSPSLVPFLIFLISCFIAFSTGTSWGTFAIMIPIAVPMARELGADEILVIAAALGGGIFGDHCSPISDTTILSSMAAATDHIDHVRTQIPYALLVGAISAILYLILGMVT